LLAFLLLSASIAGRAVRAQTTPLPSGSVGIGTYATVAQFKDLLVQYRDQTILQKSLADGLTDFDVGAGQWKIIDGFLQQSSPDAAGMNIFTGSKSWTDYVVTVKARKVTGKEGFSLSFRAVDKKNFACLNVGGWNNTKTQFGLTINGTFSTIGDSTNMKVEEDRWYDVKVDVKGDEATGFVDGKKVASAKLIPPPPQPAAARSNAGGRAGAPGRAGGSGNASPAVTTPVSTSTSLGDKLIFVGATAVIVGLVVVGVMWARTRLNGKAT